MVMIVFDMHLVDIFTLFLIAKILIHVSLVTEIFTIDFWDTTISNSFHVCINAFRVKCHSVLWRTLSSEMLFHTFKSKRARKTWYLLSDGVRCFNKFLDRLSKWSGCVASTNLRCRHSIDFKPCCDSCARALTKHNSFWSSHSTQRHSSQKTRAK